MAQHFQMRYIDDIDGSDLGSEANTLFFAFDGREYSIDLSDENADTFREVVAPYIEAGHRVTGNKTKSSQSSRKATTKTASGDTKAIREWARDNGHDVSDRGRIPATVMEAYAAAN
ncbi:Lsr2 family protein [Dietzia kunjamensis]|uniref:histone-like nucleoid-structuring protein Lsr2 n=1 Tax=Dietzia TaxID=37914 RepID=UPI0022B4EBE8|nr:MULTISPECIES: Lsr2 family protein [Dietzia]MCZ4541351.1 Lsr2 family protein [Dietzia maris]MDJ0423864.1 Lsr2 family protein [Dietzia kunjamensis]